jgi:hypothetical protein
MPLMGVSGLDLKNAGWNLAVEAGVASTCALVAYVVKEIGSAAFTPSTPAAKRKFTHFCQWTGFALGTAAAIYIDSRVSASRFALIRVPSIGKMVMFGAVQAVAGFIGDLIADSAHPIFMLSGMGGAIAGRWNCYALIGFGTFGALLGSSPVKWRAS